MASLTRDLAPMVAYLPPMLKLPKMTKQADLKSVEHLPAGIYFAKISTAHQAMGQKLVKN